MKSVRRRSQRDKIRRFASSQPLLTRALITDIAALVYLGFLGGASTIYSVVLRPLLKQYEGEIDARMAEAKEKAQEAKAAAMAAAQDAIKQE